MQVIIGEWAWQSHHLNSDSGKGDQGGSCVEVVCLLSHNHINRELLGHICGCCLRDEGQKLSSILMFITLKIILNRSSTDSKVELLKEEIEAGLGI